MYFQVIINSFSGFGPFCLCFRDNEPCTVYDLKKRLATTTAFSVEEQRIRSLGGKILTDSDDLLKDYALQEGPIVLNLTVRLIGGRTRHKRIDNTTTQRHYHQPLSKKLRLHTADILIHRDSTYDMSEQPTKGKEKETRKRKH
ncbi:uncharacterized protein B0P05DRAFT_567824 [Gilbertella persicaria]|uniref:uncharacterized protein n=1 Tax=Gilbertella persicaria TaxID=101096 RepID=UPI0022204F15|nr:uncharacterized protein B0P05DRAFT_567824 [Gilbertella persicaria]KAI8097835.1 hypothetical protein B0P05DRAFT_567824 [Gilbertella persicaria]